MTEADLTSEMVELIRMFFAGVSVFATLISAFIVALYAFLRRADLGLRAVTFGFLTLTLVLISISAFGAYRHAYGINLALADIRPVKRLSALGRMALEPTAGNVFVLTSAEMLGLALLLNVGLAYLTFFHRYKKSNDCSGDRVAPKPPLRGNATIRKIFAAHCLMLRRRASLT